MTAVSERRLVVLGPGAVGGLLASMLIRAGTEVVVAGRPEAMAAIDRGGLTVHSDVFGTWTGRPVTVTELPHGADVVLAVKAFGLSSVLAPLERARPATLLTVLNGIGHVQMLRRRLPDTRVVPATIKVEAQRVGRSEIHHRSPFLSLSVPASERSSRSVDALARAGAEVTTERNEVDVLWRKYRFLVPMALLTAYHQTPLGEAMERDRRLTSGVIAEVAAVATAAGLATTVPELAAILNRLPPAMRSSLQLDLAAGGDTELEAIGGALLDFAGTAGLSVPHCAEVVDVLRSRGGSSGRGPR